MRSDGRLTARSLGAGEHRDHAVTRRALVLGAGGDVAHRVAGDGGDQRVGRP
jgi:hypothetical protein